MTYLTLSADYGAVSLRDEQTGSLAPGDIGLPDELIADLEEWNRDYQAIIPLGPDRRRTAKVISLIAQLDRTGLQFAERIAEAVPGNAKVRYFSEGLLRVLSSEEAGGEPRREEPKS
jgi:hypothetical protein